VTSVNTIPTTALAAITATADGLPTRHHQAARAAATRIAQVELNGTPSAVGTCQSRVAYRM
jgi:hypothetical protein